MTKSISYQLSVSYKDFNPISAEIVRGVLINLGVEEFEITELTKEGRSQFLIYFSRRDKCNKLAAALKKSCIKGLIVKKSLLKKKDWETKWKEDFKPFKLTKKFAVVPEWYRKKYKTKSLIPIYIDSGIAFGTGLHPTTRYVSMFIERFHHKINRFLDLGTGTGILSVIAHHCGAKTIHAVDISSDAVKTAKMNLRNNDISKARVIKEDVHQSVLNEKYDFVAANLITEDLLQSKKKIVSLVEKGGLLAVSGVSLFNANRFRREFSSSQLRLLKIEKGEGWAGFLYQKN